MLPQCRLLQDKPVQYKASLGCLSICGRFLDYAFPRSRIFSFRRSVHFLEAVQIARTWKFAAIMAATEQIHFDDRGWTRCHRQHTYCGRTLDFHSDDGINIFELWSPSHSPNQRDICQI